MRIGTVNTKTMLWMMAILVGAALPAGCDKRPPADDVTKVGVSAERAVTVGDDFESALTDWQVVAGDWRQRTADGRGVLAQAATDQRYPVALWKKQRFSDVDVTVRFKPISGRIDASGGIVLRATDGSNYYVVRANSLEDNVRLYTVIDGRRSKIAGARVDAPALGQWHALRVVAVGAHIQAYLNDQLLIDHHDETFSTGWVGLWTKADAVTDFDDLAVTGVAEASN